MGWGGFEWFEWSGEERERGEAVGGEREERGTREIEIEWMTAPLEPGSSLL